MPLVSRTIPGVFLAKKLIASARVAEGSQPTQLARRSSDVRDTCARLFVAAQALRFGLTEDAFQSVLLEVAAKYLPSASDRDLISFLQGLHAEELALTRGCVLGNETAWEVFMTRYRASLYEAAYAVAKDESVGRELADSLYAELYGIPKENGEHVSKLRYYMGRGSLAGWLRTVLAQEFVNRYRRTRHEVSLEARIEEGTQFTAPATSNQDPGDARVDQAISDALASVAPDDRFILSAYYLDGRTLAEIARVLQVHESTVSRKLEKVVGALRKEIRKRLVDAGMSSRQADEVMQDVDVRDLNVNVRSGLQQESPSRTFYNKEKGTSQ